MRACGRDKNSEDVAQATHKHLLRSVDALDPRNELPFGKPLPSGPVWEGIYIDNYIVICKTPRNQLCGPAFEEAKLLIVRSREAYSKAHDLHGL